MLGWGSDSWKFLSPRTVKSTIKPHIQTITLNKLGLLDLIQNGLFCSKDSIKEFGEKLLGSHEVAA